MRTLDSPSALRPAPGAFPAVLAIVSATLTCHALVTRRGHAKGPQVLTSSHTNSTNYVISHGVAASAKPEEVSTCVTRSLGDWDGARAMIPQPDLEQFQVCAANGVIEARPDWR